MEKKLATKPQRAADVLLSHLGGGDDRLHNGVDALDAHRPDQRRVGS